MIKLTEYSDKGGCGCKLEKGLLSELLSFNNPSLNGNNEEDNYLSMDDCAVVKNGNEEFFLNTIDFFSPLVDDPFLFGKIAALNSVSDIYAMGGSPIQAVSILGWNENIPIEHAKEILEGASSIGKELNFTISGGHTISNSQPIFGLSIFGKVLKKNIKRLMSNKSQCDIYITKPIGLGVLSSAIKSKEINSTEYNEFINLITKSNKIGIEIGKLSYVSAMTDITGFGLLGHLANICNRNNLDALIDFNKVPIIQSAKKYFELGKSTSTTLNNYKSIKDNISNISDYMINLLFDPQTNGGLLVLVDKNYVSNFETTLNEYNQDFYKIGSTAKSKLGFKIKII